jgi:coenzyme F420-0:L-glutamate ligase/coenzyme F420-1:gamma-L-glutamate ligase
MLSAEVVPDLPEFGPGDDLAALVGPHVTENDVVVIAHKVVSKIEGAVVRLCDVQVGERSRELAERHGKDPAHMQVILGETAEIVRERSGVLICRTHHGFVCANAGVDESNAPEAHVITLPQDPDASARRIRGALGVRCAVVIADSFGRAWRVGQSDIAIGAAGIRPLDDWRGRRDAHDRVLHATLIAIADEAAAAADLARQGKDAGEPVVLLRGLGRFVTDDDGPGAAALLRERSEDLFL